MYELDIVHSIDGDLFGRYRGDILSVSLAASAHAVARDRTPGGTGIISSPKACALSGLQQSSRPEKKICTYLDILKRSRGVSRAGGTMQDLLRYFARRMPKQNIQKVYRSRRNREQARRIRHLFRKFSFDGSLRSSGVEQRSENPFVAGSIPAVSTIEGRSVAQSGKSTGLGSRGSRVRIPPLRPIEFVSMSSL